MHNRRGSREPFLFIHISDRSENESAVNSTVSKFAADDGKHQGRRRGDGSGDARADVGVRELRGNRQRQPDRRSRKTSRRSKAFPPKTVTGPLPTWADQFGDAQLKALIDEALKGSPTIAQARARVAAAQAYSETAKASTTAAGRRRAIRSRASSIRARRLCRRRTRDRGNPRTKACCPLRTISTCGARIAKR